MNYRGYVEPTTTVPITPVKYAPYVDMLTPKPMGWPPIQWTLDDPKKKPAKARPKEAECFVRCVEALKKQELRPLRYMIFPLEQPDNVDSGGFLVLCELNGGSMAIFVGQEDADQDAIWVVDKRNVNDISVFAGQVAPYK